VRVLFALEAEMAECIVPLRRSSSSASPCPTDSVSKLDADAYTFDDIRLPTFGGLGES
jgi:hypothetical protein